MATIKPTDVGIRHDGISQIRISASTQNAAPPTAVPFDNELDYESSEGGEGNEEERAQYPAEERRDHVNIVVTPNQSNDESIEIVEKPFDEEDDDTQSAAATEKFQETHFDDGVVDYGAVPNNQSSGSQETLRGAAFEEPVSVVDVTPITQELYECIKQGLEVEPDKFRSPELVSLMGEYDRLSIKVRRLVASTEKYHAATTHLDKTKEEMIDRFAVMTHETPIHQYVGQASDAESLRAVNYSTQRQTALISRDFESQVLRQVAEWEKFVRLNVDPQIASVVALQKSRMHYETKMPAVRAKINQLLSAGKEVDVGTEEHLARNEEKLKAAFAEHERAAYKLCIWLEEIVENGWEDIVPLLMKAMELMFNRAEVEHHVINKRLPDVVDSLEQSMADFML